LVKIEQKLDQVKEQYKQFGSYKEDPYLSSLLPAVLVQAAEKHMAEVDAALDELPLVLTEGWVGDFKQVLERASAAAAAGQTSNNMLLDMVQMATTMQGNA
jgi:septation ring formation regulator EzrA